MMLGTNNNQFLTKLEAAIRDGVSKHVFLSLVDSTKHHIFDEFASRYPTPYAKLMALKTVNLIVAKYHYAQKHTTIASRPIQLMVDPANACQLHCPGCVHTSNPEWAKHAALDWPPGMLPLEQYRKVLRLYGPFAFGAVLYNYGEPLLNSLTPHYIALARQYLLFTLLSTNLSLPKIDIEALVRSGLNHMIISIDGVTQKTYEQYRRGGNLDLVFENLRKLVEVKKRLGQKTPYLVWQFLTFEHNLHEVDSAIETANNMGVDAIQILTPLDVSMDDPTCRIAKSSREGYHCFNPWQARLNNLSEPPLDLASGPEIDLYLNESLIERMQAIGGINEASHNGSSRCGWLYKNISVDGLGRILPCCNSPAKDRHLVFGNLQKDNSELWNSLDFVLSRLSLSDRKVFLQNSKSDISYCGTCTATSEPPNNLWRVAEDMQILDKYEVIPKEFVGWLTAW